MKLITLIVFFGVSNLAFANDLCNGFKPELSERRDESQFNLENYRKALDGLKKYYPESGIDPWPYMVVLEGYLLRQQALDELASSKSGPAVKAFCEFIVQQGVHRG
jgi:hypothetical protein